MSEQRPVMLVGRHSKKTFFVFLNSHHKPHSSHISSCSPPCGELRHLHGINMKQLQSALT